MTRVLIASIFLISFSCGEKRKEESGEKVMEIPSEETTTVKAVYRTLDLLTHRVKLELPENLQPMNTAMFRLKYPSEKQSTTIAYSNEDATVSFLISQRQDILTIPDLPTYQKIFDKSFGKNPFINFKKSEIRNINGRDFIVIEMITPAADTGIFNKMVVTSCRGHLLVMTFNCTIEKQGEWQPTSEKIISSLMVKD